MRRLASQIISFCPSSLFSALLSPALKSHASEASSSLGLPASGGENIARSACQSGVPASVPEHELLRSIGVGSYGEVWLARSVLGSLRAVKVVYRKSFDHDRPYEREFEGLKKFEPLSHARESQVDIFHVGRNDDAGFFYYIMELADAVENPKPERRFVQHLAQRKKIGLRRARSFRRDVTRRAHQRPRIVHVSDEAGVRQLRFTADEQDV